MTDQLLLVAAGGLAREAAEAVRLLGRDQVLGFLDDDEHRHGTEVDGAPVLGGLAVTSRYPDARVLVCTGRGASRLALVERLAAAGVGPDRYATLIGPGVNVPGTCTVGAGSILLAGTTLTAGVHIGRHVVCMPRVVLTHDNHLADGATLCAGVVLGGDVHVGGGAYIGMAAAVREGVRIGAGSVVGMGAVVLQDVPDGDTWAGVPAGPLRSSRVAVVPV